MADPPSTRPYHSPLRERQTAGTTRQILEAAAEFIVTGGLTEFSMREVAAHAGVSERTVYHHFPGRQAIIDGLMAWVDEQLRERRLQADPREVTDFPGRIRDIFAAFDEIGTPARAMARLSAGQGMRSAEYHQRTAAFRERFADVLDPLPQSEADRCFAILRHIASATTWFTLRDEFELDSQDAADAIAWTLQTLLDDLSRRGA